MKSLYTVSSCAVKVDGVLSEFILIRSGVGQGCVLSPCLFGIVIYMILKIAMIRKAGISWVDDGKTLSDLDFADDIALFYESWNGMRTITSTLENKT